MSSTIPNERVDSGLSISDSLHDSNDSNTNSVSSLDTPSDNQNKPIRRSLYLEIANESPSSSDSDGDSPLPSEVSIDDHIDEPDSLHPGLETYMRPSNGTSGSRSNSNLQPETSGSPSDELSLFPIGTNDHNSIIVDNSLDDELPSSDPNDDFISSDDDALTRTISSQFTSFGSGTTFAEHVLYFRTALDNCLDSLQLDKSLVAQSKLSGQLIDTNRLLVEKLQELQESLRRLQQLFHYHITSKRIDFLDSDLKGINNRIENLKRGTTKSLFFGTSKLGVMDKYPIEYNQARDKILERPEE